MTEREVLKLALEALEGYESCIDGYYANAVCPQIDKAIVAIKEALAQPEQEPVAHSVVAGALFDFMGWLTSRNKRLTLSGADEASPAVEAIQEFSEKRGLSLKDAEVGFWTEFLSTPPPVAEPHKCPSRSDIKPLTDEEILTVARDHYNPHQRAEISFARAIEAAHGIKGEA